MDISTFKDKDSRKPEYRQLYEDHDFITAYGLHTDMRIEKDGPELAIGAKRDGEQDWEIHSQRQLDFLISQGLLPHHRLLDFGCGTGRLASVAVPYLQPGKYLGIDISRKAVKCAIKYCVDYGLFTRYPAFKQTNGGLEAVKGKQFDFIFAHSVFTHLPPEIVAQIFSDLSEMDFGEFWFTFKQADAPQRSGLKQFQFSVESLQSAAHNYGLKAEPFPYEWPAGQKTMKIIHE